jgi:CrcB protein
MMHALRPVLLVAIGSALGGLTRWGVGLACTRWIGTAFPVGTFAINITGSLFLGWFLTTLRHQVAAPGANSQTIEQLYMLIAVGFTGSYTTFSTFAFESDSLIDGGKYFVCASYVALSVFIGLASVRLGIWLAEF